MRLGGGEQGGEETGDQDDSGDGEHQISVVVNCL